jgi:hypothetical protein
MRRRLITANLFDFNKSPATRDRQDRQVAWLRDQQPFALVVQEFWHETRDPDDKAMAGAFAEFADQVGMDGRLAYARSFCHVGVLWQPNQARLDSWQEFGKWPFHHNLAMATLDVGEHKPWRIATTQLSPAGPDPRSTEGGLVAMAGLGNPDAITFVGLDINEPSAEPALPGQKGEFYDPEPYEHQEPGLPHQLFQVKWNDDPKAKPIVDRRGAAKLLRADLVDVAWHLKEPWTPTTGHHPSDPHGDRRIDGWRASAAARERVTGIEVTKTDHSDHREVILTTE